MFLQLHKETKRFVAGLPVLNETVVHLPVALLHENLAQENEALGR